MLQLISEFLDKMSDSKVQSISSHLSGLAEFLFKLSTEQILEARNDHNPDRETESPSASLLKLGRKTAPHPGKLATIDENADENSVE